MNKNLKEVAKVFFKLGCIAFGGPAAHIAMMEEEIVKKRKWMSEQHFLDLIGATNLIPGPNSTEMTMHCGYERAGWKGVFVAGGLFIFPAVLITLLISYLYVKYGQLPEVAPFIYGIKPAVIAIILSALYRLGKKALKNKELYILGIITLIVTLCGVHEILALLGCGMLGILWHYTKNFNSVTKSLIPFFILKASNPLFSAAAIKIFLTFLKVGAILCGSGYVLFAFLDAELVATGLLSRPELMDAIAVGQITPGPVLSTATFIGYQLGGFSGAIMATLGIFLPSFIFVTILNPLVPKLRKHALLSAFLDAVNVAAVAVILAVCIDMGLESITDWKTALIAVISISLVFGYKKLNSVWIVLGGSILGYFLH
ncbi:MAG: chromate efflux transporter [Saprospiraceae bacterium]